MQFIDKSKIRVVSGKGGNGVVAWRREKFVDKGGPAGGDGGDGGSIYLVADTNMSTLMDFKHKSVYKALPGENGAKKNCYGADAPDLIIKVPVGTVVKDCKSDKIIADLTADGQKVLVAKGGRGGRGNTHFATAQKRAPQFCEPGEPSIERELFLELKLIADVGLLGMPNAGKSTFISRVSSAKPKIADYPFTTLIPNLGVVRKPSGDGFVIADIPGLIEGASDGIGLGHDFLRHVERCRFLVHMIDSSVENPMDNYKKINIELKKYSEKLSQLYQIVVLNKIDAIDETRRDELKKQFKICGKNLFFISAVTGENVDSLLDFITEKVDTIEAPVTEVVVEEDTEASNNDDSAFEVSKIKDGYFISGGKINRLASVTDTKNSEQVIRFQNILKSMGVFDKLKKLGVKDGDTVVVGNLEFEYYADEFYG
ncbi:MAG: GTPase ObgE [Clostridiaceae bacterium]|jgi:GTPase|nr:GTPase ObgE [Clostridiaceae bacterium]